MNGLCKNTRREFLWEAGAGFTGLAMTGMLSADGFFRHFRVYGVRGFDFAARRRGGFWPESFDL